VYSIILHFPGVAGERTRHFSQKPLSLAPSKLSRQKSISVNASTATGAIVPRGEGEGGGGGGGHVCPPPPPPPPPDSTVGGMLCHGLEENDGETEYEDRLINLERYFVFREKKTLM